MIIFTPNGKIIKDGWPEIRNKKMKWGSTAIRMEFSYKEGYIETTKGTKVLAYEYIPKSLKVELFDKITGKNIPKLSSFLKQFNFDLSYNCFGYCFADSKVFLPDPTSFLKEEYEEVAYEKAELILFKVHEGFGDNGEEVINYFHVVKVLANGKVSFKPGINKIVQNVDEELAIHNYNFNHEVYFKKKEIKKKNLTHNKA
jgi:hypothetical protein